MADAARRSVWALFTLMLLGSACTSGDGVGATSTPPPEVTTSGPEPAVPTSTVVTTTTLGGAVTTATSTTSTTTLPEPFFYFVVAEEDSRRLAVIEPVAACPTGECAASVRVRFDLPHRPHNLASAGSVVFATHPAAGALSRVDVASGEATTIPLGVEPHDVKYDPVTDRVLVADEAGRHLFYLDPVDLSILQTIDLPAQPHDLYVGGDAVWVTLLGRAELARVSSEGMALVAVGGAPHDLVVAGDGRIWFSNWNSSVLSVFDPATSQTERAPAGVSEPHHFAIDARGAVWVSDNGGSAIVGFTDPLASVEVGPVPHHLAFAGEALMVAVSGSGEAVQVAGGEVVARTTLSPGLHGVTVVQTMEPLG